MAPWSLVLSKSGWLWIFNTLCRTDHPYLIAWLFRTHSLNWDWLKDHIKLLFSFCCCFCSVAKLWQTLWDPMVCSTPDLPVFHYLLEFAQIQVHWVGDVSPSICHEVMGPDAVIFVFWMLSFKPTFSLYSFTFIKRLFSSSSLSAIGEGNGALLQYSCPENPMDRGAW